LDTPSTEPQPQIKPHPVTTSFHSNPSFGNHVLVLLIRSSSHLAAKGNSSIKATQLYRSLHPAKEGQSATCWLNSQLRANTNIAMDSVKNFYFAEVSPGTRR